MARDFFPSHYYISRRKNTFVIGIDHDPCEGGFCRSLGTDVVTHGFDLFLTDLGDKYFVEILSASCGLGPPCWAGPRPACKGIGTPLVSCYKLVWRRAVSPFESRIRYRGQDRFAVVAISVCVTPVQSIRVPSLAATL